MADTTIPYNAQTTQNDPALERISLLTDVWSVLSRHGIFPPSSLNPDLSSMAELKVVDAIMSEELLPQMPSALVEGILEEGSKALISGAPKTWKSFLMISLGLAVATGGEWLGAKCKQGSVAYLNLEIGSAQFMRRVYDMATGIDADKELVESNFKILELDGYMTIQQFADKLITNKQVRNCKLLIIDPLYKIFSGSENSQEDMAAFLGEIDRIIKALGCSVVVVHHFSKGYQGFKDTVDKACGSGVVGRDPDTIITLERLAAKSGNAMRASFAFRGFDERGPIDYWVKLPSFVVDTEGELANYKAGHGNAVSRSSDKQKRMQTLEHACQELLSGREKVKRKELEDILGWKPGTIDAYLEESTRFMKSPTDKNPCMVMRRPLPSPL